MSSRDDGTPARESRDSAPVVQAPEYPVGTCVVAQWSPRRTAIAFVIGHDQPGNQAVLCGRYRARCFANVLPVIREATPEERADYLIENGAPAAVRHLMPEWPTQRNNALPFGARFELTTQGQVHQSYRVAGDRIPSQAVFIQDGIPRKLSDGELTSCPSCCTFPCSCDDGVPF